MKAFKQSEIQDFPIYISARR